MGWQTGIIGCSHQITGKDDFPLAQWLREQTRVRHRVDNDANAAALGEDFVLTVALFLAGSMLRVA